MAARKNTLADAVALIEINNGWKHFVQPHVQSQLWEALRLTNIDDLMKNGRMYDLTDYGRELLAQSPLWAAHQRLLGRGYEVDRGNDPIRPRRRTKGYIPYRRWNAVINQYDTAWISATRRQPAIFISRRQSEGGTYQLGAE